MRFVRCLAVAVALASVGCSQSNQDAQGGDSPEAALKRQIAFISDGQYRRAYGELHPVQQALFTPEQYEACVSKAAGAIDVESVKIKETFEETLTIPGTSQSVQAVAITAEVKVKGIAEVQTDTYHEIRVGDSWRFTASAAPDIVAGTC